MKQKFKFKSYYNKINYHVSTRRWKENDEYFAHMNVLLVCLLAVSRKLLVQRFSQLGSSY